MPTSKPISSKKPLTLRERVQDKIRRMAAALGLRPMPIEPNSLFEGGLGLNHIPNALGLLPCQTPSALLLQDSNSAHAWLHAALADTLAFGPVFLVTTQANWIHHALKQNPALLAALDQRRLLIWQVNDSSDLTEHIVRDGLDHFFRDLPRHGLRTDHALFFVGFQTWFVKASVQQLQRLGQQIQKWAQIRSRPSLWAFMPQNDSNKSNKDEGKEPKSDVKIATKNNAKNEEQAHFHEDLLSRLRSLGSAFRHLACLGRDGAHTRFYVDRWDSPDGAVFQSHYGLKLDISNNARPNASSNASTNPNAVYQRLRYNGQHTHGPAQQVVEAPDQFMVWATHAAVAGQSGLPTHWNVLPNLAAVLAATEESIAATLLLDAGNLNDFDALSRAIHALRLSHPRSLKIVVRETTAKLRSNSEQALLQLGANAVFYKEIGFARMLQSLQDLQDQSFTRNVPTDYEQALSAFMPDAARGYLSPDQFCSATIAMLDRSLDMGIHHSVVRLPVLPEIPHLDAISAFSAKRDGDLLTADSESLYVFLFACLEADVEAALGRLFKLPVTQLFSSQISDSSQDGVRSLLQPLQEAAAKGLPDYSLYLSKLADKAPTQSEAKPEEKSASNQPQALQPLEGSAIKNDSPKEAKPNLRKEKHQPNKKDANEENTWKAPEFRAHPIARRPLKESTS